MATRDNGDRGIERLFVQKAKQLQNCNSVIVLPALGLTIFQFPVSIVDMHYLYRWPSTFFAFTYTMRGAGFEPVLKPPPYITL